MKIRFILAIIISFGIIEPCSSIVTNQKVFESTGGSFDNVRDALRNSNIIDEVVDDFKPKCFLVPAYGKHHKPVALGNTFSPSKTRERPSLKIYCPHIHGLDGLTIALTDPDAPSRDNPEWSEVCHWIAFIPLPERSFLDLSLDTSFQEKDLIEYKPPGPPPETGYHRYAFFLLEGDNTNLTAPRDRKHWGTGRERHGVRDWAASEGLNVIGANFFLAKNKKA